ncbi:hypothetical protein FC83_GL002817 [Agrilactobacillus composti DSM 18527 = JCM 14202]|uniref:Uncharacterized protein n=1 Tax=Agrilactobacillus composti DSM 18527 = JCM 14202 TaxID=1423734 RepID=X0PS89_9LACO|nr:hypothetical protein [Agrilactobacillus composti]KRM33426.1 hypothetical protein FC83_GL002817 [Agrilactobacillus composti DSM 18527 = JCM 14202]GAF40762.1 hypothetical protein JCM14202_2668 [Agrilactobacillus composti DSM 18527 = JCM 14202]
MISENDTPLTIDPQNFAKLVVADLNFKADENPQAISKRALIQYLSAYYLADQFNQYETEIFQKDGASTYPSYADIKELMNKTKWY